MDKQQTIHLLTLIASNYDNFMPSDSTRKKIFVDNWSDALEDIQFEDAVVAYKQHMRESVYAPKVADIYQRVINKVMPTFPDAVEEFNKVIRACQKFGYNRADEAMQSFNEYTRRVVDMNGGFRKFCMSNSDDEISHRKHFTETYNRLIDREIKTIKEGGFVALQLDNRNEQSRILNNKIDALVRRMD